MDIKLALLLLFFFEGNNNVKKHQLCGLLLIRLCYFSYFCKGLQDKLRRNKFLLNNLFSLGVPFEEKKR